MGGSLAKVQVPEGAVQSRADVRPGAVTGVATDGIRANVYVDSDGFLMHHLCLTFMLCLTVLTFGREIVHAWSPSDVIAFFSVAAAASVAHDVVGYFRRKLRTQERAAREAADLGRGRWEASRRNFDLGEVADALFNKLG